MHDVEMSDVLVFRFSGCIRDGDPVSPHRVPCQLTLCCVSAFVQDFVTPEVTSEVFCASVRIYLKPSVPCPMVAFEFTVALALRDGFLMQVMMRIVLLLYVLMVTNAIGG